MVRHDYQDSDYSCGPAALQMLLEHAGLEGPGEPSLMDEVGLDIHGTHVDELAAAVERRGLEHVHWHGDVSLGDLQDLIETHAVMVCHQSRVLRVGHFSVVTAIGPSHIMFDDPWFGPATRMELQDFMDCWRSEPEGSAPRRHWLLAIRRGQ